MTPEGSGNSATIEEGDLVLFIISGRRGEKKFIRRAKRGQKFHTHAGLIEYNDIIGREWGFRATTNLGREVLVLEPTLADLIEKLPRKTQIIYPKDAAFALIKSGVRPGSTVVEGGTGSGSLALCLSRAVGEGGSVVSYEINERILRRARRNLEALGANNIVLKNKDMREKIDERDVDAVFLDLGDPWEVMPEAKAALKPGGVVCVFVPSYEQVKKSVLAGRELGFSAIEVDELLLRGYDVNAQRTRPRPWMIGHTVFLITMRKVLGGDLSLA